jgi:hypothetical protein
MHRVVPVALVVAACGGTEVPTGTYRVSWTLTSQIDSLPTCAGYLISDVVVSATDTSSGETHAISASCDTPLVEILVPLGNHRITATAIGIFGDQAGEGSATDSLTLDQQLVTLSPISVPVAPPATEVDPRWTITAGGQPASCGAIANNGVEIDITPASGPATQDFYDCSESLADIAAPYGPFQVQAKLLDAQDTPIASSEVEMVDAHRGPTGVTLAIAAN